ncbi:hypothetical protein BJV82DRAFT_164974 [Fennellomyces sp. T-0311]|nr:hypothetical protein BJV82DRAFT_164974 [Fennellomyces sp. T-0311]
MKFLFARQQRGRSEISLRSFFVRCCSNPLCFLTPTMNDQSEVVLHPQLNPPNFDQPFTDSDSEGERDPQGSSEAPIVPVEDGDEPHTVRVARPVPPIEYGPQPPLLSTKELMGLAFRPAALNTRVACRICRYRDGLDKIYPQYQLLIEHLRTGEVQHVMTARKKRKSQTSYYTISGVVHDTPESAGRLVELGKVRSNFLGTTFVIYSHGRNPLKKEAEAGKSELPVREEMGAVLYVREAEMAANKREREREQADGGMMAGP